MYSNLRFVICASLIGCAGLIGVLALLPPTLEDRLLASEQLSDPPASACDQQNWWHFDRKCLSRRGMPWVSPAPNAVESRSSAESAPEQPSDTQASVSTQSDTSTGSARSEPSTASAQFETSAQSSASTESSALAQPSAAAAEKLAQPSEVTAPSEVSASRQEAGTSIAEEPRLATPQSEVPAPQQASAPPVAGERHVAKQRNVTRHAPPVVTERRVAKPVVESQPPAAKKTTREARGAKPSNEALNTVRKFQDNLRDIPVSSYAADGTQRRIVIRPTSIQDVYYYSAPR